MLKFQYQSDSKISVLNRLRGSMRSGSLVLPLLLLIVMMLIFSLINPNFLSYFNMMNLLVDTSTVLVVALGVTFVIMMGSIDLSIGGMVTLIDIIIPFLLVGWVGGLGSVLVSLGIGASFGLATGLLVTKAKAPSFLITIGTMFVATGLAKQIFRRVDYALLRTTIGLALEWALNTNCAEYHCLERDLVCALCHHSIPHSFRKKCLRSGRGRKCGQIEWNKR